MAQVRLGPDGQPIPDFFSQGGGLGGMLASLPGTPVLPSPVPRKQSGSAASRLHGRCHSARRVFLGRPEPVGAERGSLDQQPARLVRFSREPEPQLHHSGGGE
jgi:hypothetical protein